MAANSPATQPGEPLIAAKDRIQLGPVPGWVQSCPFRIDFTSQQPAPVTYLLLDQQIHAAARLTFFHVALRLETMQAVHDLSPWRLDFNPRRQQITLHSLQTWRGGAQFDHANLSSARISDNPAASSAPPDRVALLLMLDDLRPGDVLEWSYTVESRTPVLPEHCAAMLVLPAGAPVGKLCFSVLFNPSRQMRWRASAPEWPPVEKQADGNVLWTWTRDNAPGLPVEPNTPQWQIPSPWIQISDCPDWGAISAAFAQAWKEDEDDAAVRKIAGEIAAGTGGILEQTEKAIRMVQDEYRHLAVNGQLDGQPPVPPAVAARRRYGDCKDLAFLLQHLLNRLGVPARLILVNTVWRKSIAQLLPAPGLFNHVLVEYEVGGETRWADATLEGQRDGALRRVVQNYGAGLPVGGLSDHLVQLPAGPDQNSLHELKESILLDSSGGWSRLAVVVRARGLHAEALRRELAGEGLEALAEKRLRLCLNRFTSARRARPLEYRDDRAANEFFLAEIFEIKDFLVPDPKSNLFKLDLPNDYAVNLLQIPEPGPRRAPFALPYPCNIVHTIELHSVALPPAVVQQRALESDYLRFTRLRTTLAGSWTMTLSLSTLADAVPPESLDEHRAMIRKIRAQSAWSILVPPGHRHPNQRADFGALPNSCKPASSESRLPGTVAERPPPISHDSPPANGAPDNADSVAPSLANGTVVAQPAAPAQTRAHKSKLRRKRNHRRHNAEPKARWHVIAACLMAVALIVIVFLTAKNADRWLQLFKLRPAPPTPLNTVPPAP